MILSRFPRLHRIVGAPLSNPVGATSPPLPLRASAALATALLLLLPPVAQGRTISGAEIDPVILDPDESLEVTADGSIDTLGDPAVLTDPMNSIGSISNAGRITSDTDAIGIAPEVTLTGDITNSGFIGSGSYPVFVGFDSVITGTISNTATGEMEGGEDGITVVAGASVGNISNAGSITAFTYDGIYLDAEGMVTGSISNLVGAVITGEEDGIAVEVGSSVGADITNAGTINALQYDGIFLFESSVSGNIRNLEGGVINAATNGIAVEGLAPFEGGSGSLVGGDITNAGTINADENDGIWVYESIVEGSISNLETGLIDAEEDGIAVEGFSLVEGDISNAGEIIADSEDGIYFEGAQVLGSVLNSGSINAELDGIYLDLGSYIGGDIINSAGGEIIAGEDGIDFEPDCDCGGGPLGSAITGNIINEGLIDAGFDGIELDAGSVIGEAPFGIGPGTGGDPMVPLDAVADATPDSGAIINRDRILAVDDGIAAYEGSVISNGIWNEGLIDAEDEGINLNSTLIEMGGINNAAGATIDAADDAIDLDDSIVEDGINNDGSIVAADDAINIVGNSLVSGGITNTNMIQGGDKSIDIESESILDGDILNSGSLIGGINIEGDSGSGDGIDLTNRGLVDLKQQGGYLSGDFIQDSDGTLAMELFEWGHPASSLGIADNATLDGELQLTFTVDFLPRRLTRHIIMSAEGITGEFSNYADGDLIGMFDDIPVVIEYRSDGIALYALPLPGVLPLFVVALSLFGRRLIGRSA